MVHEKQSNVIPHYNVRSYNPVSDWNVNILFWHSVKEPFDHCQCGWDYASVSVKNTVAGKMLMISTFRLIYKVYYGIGNPFGIIRKGNNLMATRQHLSDNWFPFNLL